MIKQENVRIGKFDFTHTKSDFGFFIKQKSTGIIYEEAYDLSNHPQEYEETDQKIESDADPEEEGEIE